MKILNGILKFFKNAFSEKNIKFTFFVIIIILAILWLRSCDRLKQEKLDHKRDTAMYENNLVAMNDSLTTHYDKELDKQVTEKTAYLVKSMDDMKKYNEDFYNEFKGLKNMVGGIKSDVSIIIPTLTDAIGSINQDPNDSNKYSIPWEFNYSDEGLTQSLVGRSKFGLNTNHKPFFIGSVLDTNKFNVKVRYALTETDDKYVVKAFSPSKLVNFTDLDGALSIDKVVPEATTPSRWVLAPYIGVGLNTDMTGKDSRYGFSAGLALSYRVFVKTQNKKGINRLFKKVDN